MEGPAGIVEKASPILKPFPLADSRKHRGPHPKDHQLFSARQIPFLRQAVADLSLLQTKGYAEKASLKLVGDRFRLTARQRLAVLRCAASDEAVELRRKKEVPVASLKDQPVAIDGFNLIITLESAFSGAYLFVGRDGCYKDLSGIHGNYRKVEETTNAILLASQKLQEWNAGKVTWYLDRPVSNSGRLKAIITEMASGHLCDWEVVLLQNPDRDLTASNQVVITSDSNILNQSKRWFNFAKAALPSLGDANVVDLRV